MNWRFDFKNMPKDGTYCLAWVDDGKHPARAELLYWETGSTRTDWSGEEPEQVPYLHWYTDAAYCTDGEHGAGGDSATLQEWIKAWCPVEAPK